MDPAKARDLAYGKLFGEAHEAFLDKSEHPTLEVRRYIRATSAEGPACDVWVTSGMSNFLLVGDGGERLRRELLFYAPEGGNFVQPLAAVARYPFQNDTFLAPSHGIRAYGAFFAAGGAQSAAKVFTQIALPHLVLLEPPVANERKLGTELVIEGSSVEFLWVVPVSAAELEMKEDEGIASLLDLFEEQQHPFVFDAARKSYL